MRKRLKKINMLLVTALMIGIAGRGTCAQAASAWSFSDGVGGQIEVNGVLNLDKNEFRDIDLYKNGRVVKETDATYKVTWSSSDSDVVWVNKTSGKLRGDKFGKLTEKAASATITAKITNKKSGAVAKRSFVICVGESREEQLTASGAVVDMSVYPDWFALPDASVENRPTPTPMTELPKDFDYSSVAVYGTKTMYFGEEGCLYAEGTLADGSVGRIPLTYEVADENVLSIDKNGVITPVNPGTTQITIGIGDQRARYEFTVIASHYNAVKGQTKSVGKDELAVAKVVTDFIKDNIKSDMSDYEKIKLVHDYIIVNTEYKNRNNDRDHMVFGPLLDGYAVCEGYAKAFDLFMYALDIDCVMVEGFAKEPHAWNIVFVDGTPYHLDATWDDPTNPNKAPDTVNYEYFLLPEAYIRKTHSYVVTDYPYCQDTYYTYYHYRNNLIQTVSDYEDKFAELFAANPKEITILYPENKMVDKNVIYRNNGGRGYSYSVDEKGRLPRFGEYTLLRIMHNDINFND